RLGIKPLYLSWSPHRVLLASELKALVAVPGVSEVRECEPGTTTEFRWDANQGWRALEVDRRVLTSPADARGVDIDGLRHHLEKAVAEALDTRERVGVYLSGGVDSGSVFALAAARRSDVVPLTLEGPRSVDAPHATRLAHHFGRPAVRDIVPSERELFEEVA